MRHVGYSKRGEGHRSGKDDKAADSALLRTFTDIRRRLPMREYDRQYSSKRWFSAEYLRNVLVNRSGTLQNHADDRLSSELKRGKMIVQRLAFPLEIDGEFHAVTRYVVPHAVRAGDTEHGFAVTAIGPHLWVHLAEQPSASVSTHATHANRASELGARGERRWFALWLLNATKHDARGSPFTHTAPARPGLKRAIMETVFETTRVMAAIEPLEESWAGDEAAAQGNAGTLITPDKRLLYVQARKNPMQRTLENQMLKQEIMTVTDMIELCHVLEEHKIRLDVETWRRALSAHKTNQRDEWAALTAMGKVSTETTTIDDFIPSGNI